MRAWQGAYYPVWLLSNFAAHLHGGAFEAAMRHMQEACVANLSRRAPAYVVVGALNRSRCQWHSTCCELYEPAIHLFDKVAAERSRKRKVCVSWSERRFLQPTSGVCNATDTTNLLSLARRSTSKFWRPSG